MVELPSLDIRLYWLAPPFPSTRRYYQVSTTRRTPIPQIGGFYSRLVLLAAFDLQSIVGSYLERGIRALDVGSFAVCTPAQGWYSLADHRPVSARLSDDRMQRMRSGAVKLQKGHLVYEPFELFVRLRCLELHDRRTLFNGVAGFDVMMNRSGTRIGSHVLICYPLTFGTAVTHYSLSNCTSLLSEY